MKRFTSIIVLFSVLACFESISSGGDVARSANHQILDNPAAGVVQEADAAATAFLAEKLAMDEQAAPPERTTMPFRLTPGGQSLRWS